GAASAAVGGARGVLGTAGRFLGRLAPPLAVTMEAYERTEAARASPDRSLSRRQRASHLARATFGQNPLTAASEGYDQARSLLGNSGPGGTEGGGSSWGRFGRWAMGDLRAAAPNRPGGAAGATPAGQRSGASGNADLYKLFGPPPGRPAEFIEHEDVRRQAMLAAF